MVHPQVRVLPVTIRVRRSALQCQPMWDQRGDMRVPVHHGKRKRNRAKGHGPNTIRLPIANQGDCKRRSGLPGRRFCLLITA
jgi:hypothetical protein